MKKNIDFSVVTQGPMAISQHYKKPGYQYLFVGDLPGQVEYYEKLGYEIVKENAKVGDEVASNSSQIGSAVTVKSKCGQTMYLMTIEDELYNRLQEFRQKMADDQMASMTTISGIPSENQYGQVTIGSGTKPIK